MQPHGQGVVWSGTGDFDGDMQQFAMLALLQKDGPCRLCKNPSQFFLYN